MNLVILHGRLTRDPDIRWSQDGKMCIARYSVAVDRIGKKEEGKATADFPACVAFGKNGEFAEKYLRKGTEIVVTGHIQTGSYDDKDGKKVFTTEVIVERQEFAGSKKDSEAKSEGFAPVDEADLPFV